jgi:hypothetical protein
MLGILEALLRRYSTVSVFWALVYVLKPTTRGRILQKNHFSLAATFATKLGTPLLKKYDPSIVDGKIALRVVMLDRRSTR